MTTLALITGATRGIGLETARQLAQQNVRVIIGARDAAAGEKVVAELRRENLQAEAVQLDVTDSASITAAAAEIERRHGQLDVLINNAGIVVHTPDGLPSSQPIADWRRVFDTNLFGLVETTQAFLPLLRKSKAGRIVNVSSLLGSLTISETPGSPIYDMRSLPAYNVSKTAVNAWTVQLAWELRDTPIKVNAIHPGYVKTEMNDGGGEMEVADGARTSVALALIGAEGPHGKLLHAGGGAAMVSATSASRKVAFINGAERAEIYHRARLLTLQGTHVVLASKEWSKAVDASLRLQLEGLSAEALHLDARDLGNLAGVRHQLAKRHGRLDFIIDDGATTAA